MPPLHCLLTKFLQKNSLGFLLRLLQQLGDKLPIRLCDARLAWTQHGDLLRSHQIDVENLGPSITLDKDGCGGVVGVPLLKDSRVQGWKDARRNLPLASASSAFSLLGRNCDFDLG